MSITFKCVYMLHFPHFLPCTLQPYAMVFYASRRVTLPCFLCNGYISAFRSLKNSGKNLNAAVSINETSSFKSRRTYSDFSEPIFIASFTEMVFWLNVLCICVKQNGTVTPGSVLQVAGMEMMMIIIRVFPCVNTVFPILLRCSSQTYNTYKEAL